MPPRSPRAAQRARSVFGYRAETPQSTPRLRSALANAQAPNANSGRLDSRCQQHGAISDFEQAEGEDPARPGDNDQDGRGLGTPRSRYANEGRGVDQEVNDNGRPVRAQQAAGMPERYPGHNGEEHGTDGADRECMQGGCERDGSAGDGKSEERRAECHPGVADMQN